MEPAGSRITAGGAGVDAKKARVYGIHDLPPTISMEDSDQLEDPGQEAMDGLSEGSQSASAAPSPSVTPQQSYIQYQHSYSSYLTMCETSGGSYRGPSPTMVHNYPGKTLRKSPLLQ